MGSTNAEKQRPLNCTRLNMVIKHMHQICLLGLVYTGSTKRHVTFRSFWPLVLSQCSCQFDTVELPWLLTMVHIQPNNNLWVLNAKCPPHPPRTPKNHAFLKIQCYPAQMDTELIFSEFSQFYFGPVFFLLGKGTEEFRMMGSRLFMYCRSDLARMELLVLTGRTMAISWTEIHQGFSRYISYGMFH